MITTFAHGWEWRLRGVSRLPLPRFLHTTAQIAGQSEPSMHIKVTMRPGTAGSRSPVATQAATRRRRSSHSPATAMRIPAASLVLADVSELQDVVKFR